MICPQCNLENVPGDKFCGECGAKLHKPKEASEELSFNEKIDKIQRYLPKGITEKILSQRGKIEGEQKQVTVMFCDLEGFTSLVENIGPEEAYNMMDQIYEILIHKVHEYEGTVNEMTGDGVLALFGAPIALEDAPQRAIRSAMAIHKELAKFSEKKRQDIVNIQSLKMRVGIHAGPVVVGTLGNDLRVEFKAVGDTVNLASRMEGLAQPGTTYVTEETFKLTEGFFRFEALGGKRIKGKEKHVNVYRVIAPSTRRTRFDVSAERGLTQFVGRDVEIELLLNGFELSKSGRGQAFSIVSDAGVGKSRLLYEFRKAVANEDVGFIEGKCLSFGRNMTYHPLKEIVKATFDIAETDSDAEIREKLIKGLENLDTDENLTLPYLLELLSVKDSGVDTISLSNAAKQDRIVRALIQIILNISEIRPLIMAIEDLHWIDKSSEAFLNDLLDYIPGARVLLVFTYRNEFVPSWKERSYIRKINLNRLSNRESFIVIRYLLDSPEYQADLEHLIVEKTEGVPFFIEELVKALKELKIIEKKGNQYLLAEGFHKMTIPSTVQDVIMARVDTLPEGAKEVIQIGSVIEREFSYALINRVMNLPEKEVLAGLSVLRDAEFLYGQGLYPDTTYIFKHALTRDVVYDSLLTHKKNKLHHQIGEAIEGVYQKNLDDHYEALSYHFIRSGIHIKGADYSRLAALKAEKSAALINAIEHSRNRLSELELLPNQEKFSSEIIEARVTLGLYYFQMGYFPKAMESVEPIIEQAVKNEVKDKLALIYVIAGSYSAMVKEDLNESKKKLLEAIYLSETEGDFVSFGFANLMLGLVLSFNCEFEEAFFYFEKLLSVSISIQSIWRISAMKSNLSVYAYVFRGKVNLGYETSGEAIEIAEKSADILSKAMAYTSHGTACYYKGLLEEAEFHLLKGITYTEKIDLMTHSALAHQWLGHTYFYMGKYPAARHHFKKTIRIRERSGLFPSSILMNKLMLEKIGLFENGSKTELKPLYSYARDNKVKFYEGKIARYISEILMYSGERYLAEAERWIKDAIEIDRRNGMMCDLGRDYALYGQYFQRKHQSDKARSCIEKAISIFRTCGADGWLHRWEDVISDL